jgi:predicted CoA-substrate-specific enzyme activase
MNDKCAAGTGRFLEVMSRVLAVPLPDFDDVAGRTDVTQTITSTCTVFAESEVVGLMSRNVEIPRILRGLLAAIADRVAALAGQVGVEVPVAATGGTMRSKAVVDALSKALGVEVRVPDDPQTVTALGAALVGVKRLGG